MHKKLVALLILIALTALAIYSTGIYLIQKNTPPPPPPNISLQHNSESKHVATSTERRLSCADKNFECPYIVKNGEVFFYYLPIENADLETFSIINSVYSKDKSSVYYINKKIINADPETFTLIMSTATTSVTGYAHDKNNVFYLQDQLEESDIASFQVLSFDYTLLSDILGNFYSKCACSEPPQAYASDRSHIFYGKKIMTSEQTSPTPDVKFIHAYACIQSNNAIFYKEHWIGEVSKNPDPSLLCQKALENDPYEMH